MNFLRGLILFGFLYAMPHFGHTQVLISLLFGEKLNSDKIEFGLAGGFNRSYLLDIPEAVGENNFNLGFYFHILMKNQSYLSTGVLIKSSVGATGMPTYPIGDEDFDEVIKDGTLTTQIKYFHVPILFHQRFNSRWYLEGGFQLGLRSKAKDIFNAKAINGDLEYISDVSDDYKNLDAGLLGGVGYKWKKQIKSVSTGINYYYGLMNVSDLPGKTLKNSAIYLYVKVPIGAGKKGTETVVD